MKIRTLKQLRLNCQQLAIDYRGGVKNMVSLVQRGNQLARVVPPLAPAKIVVARKKDDVVVGEFQSQAEADDCIEKARKGKKAALYIKQD